MALLSLCQPNEINACKLQLIKLKASHALPWSQKANYETHGHAEQEVHI